MAREFIITVYLFIFRMFFNLFKLFPRQMKTTFVASFSTNILYTMNELQKQTDDHIVILKTHSCCIDYGNVPDLTELNFKFPHFFDWIRSIYHLATSGNIFVDNYYGFLAVTNFKSGTKCIQLWHAAGAIKQFGLKDKTINNRHSKACRRFKSVYNRFDFVVVGTENMAEVFCEAFNLSTEQILRTGIPRTDFFFNSQAMNKTEQSLQDAFPIIKEKRVILYAPTYREHQSNFQMDIEKMYKALSSEYVLFLSLHPKTVMEMENNYPDFVYDVSNYNHINHVLVITDILITDYSSIPFEFSLLHKPMVFFAYDLEEYAHEKGLWKNYETNIPGPVVKTTDDLIEVLLKGNFNMDVVKTFARKWNHYSDGRSSERLINTLYK